MKKFQEALKNLATSDSPNANVADTLFRSSKDLNEDELAIWVLKNQDELKQVLQFPSVMDEATPWKKDMMKEFFDVRNSGVSASTGDRRDVMGNPVRGIDEYMKAFGYMREDGREIDDDDRAAFTNPESPKYWGRYPDEKKAEALAVLGKDSFEEIEGDLARAGEDFQRRNQMEGYNADNSWNAPMWFASAIAGLGAPRVKEAMLDGRTVGWQDVVGDMAELGLNFIPGVGIADKWGNFVLKSSRITNEFLKDAASKAAFGAGFGLESLAQPGLAQAMDVGLLYNPDMLGTPTSGLNPRSEWSGDKLLAQTGGIGAGKAVMKGIGARVKNSLEQSVGDESAGQMYKGGFKATIENIGSKTDDMIAKRQIALDRKAELAKQRKNVSLPGDVDVARTGASVDDLYRAEDYRALTAEAERLAKSSPEREAYRDMVSREGNLYKDVNALRNEYGDLWKQYDEIDGELSFADHTPQEAAALGQRKAEIRARIDEVKARMDELENGATGYSPEASIETTSRYMAANENGTRPLIQLPDGRLVRAEFVDDAGNMKLPGMDYSVKLPEGSRYLEFKYEDSPLWDPNGEGFVPPSVHMRPREGVSLESGSRNVEVDKRLGQYPELLRKSAGSTFGRELVRDAGANAVYNMLAREGYANVGGMVGSIKDIDEKRQKALWNNMLGKLRDFTANPRLSTDDRKKYYEATMNVMYKGLDGITAEEFAKFPQVYRNIAAKLGVTDWKHPSEYEGMPEGASSTYTPESSASSSN